MHAVTRQSGRVILGGLAIALACGSLAACSSSPKPKAQPPLAPVPVKLVATSTGTSGPKHSAVPTMTIGVVFTPQSPLGQGSDWVSASTGAIVAQYRLKLGGVAVSYTPVKDDGTRPGATAAFKKLAAADVSGIVVASSGDHLDAGLKIASAAGIPTLLPYDPIAAASGDVWLTGPSQHDVDTAVGDALMTANAARPFLITADGQSVPGVTPALAARLAPSSATKLVKQVKLAVAAQKVDSVVVTGSAASEAKVITALQSASVSVPVVAGPTALSPVFASDIVADGGSTAGQFTTVGTDTGDAAALASGAGGARAGAYFAAVRLAAGDKSLHDFFGGPFSSDAPYADIASHDAVLALVDAAQKAGSADPAKIATALHALKLGAGDGLAGPDLDFTRNHALADADTVVLHATSNNPGVRPAPVTADQGGTGTTKVPMLYWFGTPHDTASGS